MYEIVLRFYGLLVRMSEHLLCYYRMVLRFNGLHHSYIQGSHFIYSECGFSLSYLQISSSFLRITSSYLWTVTLLLRNGTSFKQSTLFKYSK